MWLVCWISNHRRKTILQTFDPLYVDNTTIHKYNVQLYFSFVSVRQSCRFLLRTFWLQVVFWKFYDLYLRAKHFFFKTSSSNSFQMETNQTNVERTLVVGRDMRQNTDLYLKVVLCFAWVMVVWISVRTALILH